jgi:thiol:disulfide interchange protein DsbG
MNHRRLALSCLAALPFWLIGCSRESASTGPVSAAPAIEAAQALDALAAEARGFSVGAMMSAQTVYVMFDAQCPHCGHLWNASLPLHAKVRFVWVPVAMLGARSLPQGAALLQAAQPAEAMSAHESSLLAGAGGMAASASVPDDIRAAIEANTRLLDRMGAQAVPYIVARHAGSAQVVIHAGALDTAALAAMLGQPTP